MFTLARWGQRELRWDNPGQNSSDGGGEKRKMKKDADKITPWVVFLLFFLDGTMDLVGTVQLQNTL